MRNKALRLVVLLGFAVGAIGCGEIQMPMTLALDEGSAIGIALVGVWGDEIPLGTTELEGGVETSMTATIDLAALLLKVPIFGIIEIDDLLFAGSEFAILGIPTGTLCTIPDPNGSSGGSALIDFANSRIDFVMDLDTAIKITNPVLGNLIPDGFLFTMSVEEGADVTLAELLEMAFGNADGVLSITQDLDVSIVAEVLGSALPLHVTGQLTLSTANEFPTGDMLDECIAFLAE
jgi:hypothetical protein